MPDTYDRPPQFLVPGEAKPSAGPVVPGKEMPDGILGAPMVRNGMTTAARAAGPTVGTLSADLLKEAGKLGGDQAARIRAAQATKK